MYTASRTYGGLNNLSSIRTRQINNGEYWSARFIQVNFQFSTYCTCPEIHEELLFIIQVYCP
ncbi:hypothetical protein D3C72_1085400 [compost metagenome]